MQGFSEKSIQEAARKREIREAQDRALQRFEIDCLDENIKMVSDTIKTLEEEIEESDDNDRAKKPFLIKLNEAKYEATKYLAILSEKIKKARENYGRG